MYTHARGPRADPKQESNSIFAFLPAPPFLTKEEEAGTSNIVMALQKTLSLLLLLLLTLLGLGLVQPSYGQGTYEGFQRQHVDSTGTGGTDLYCNRMMQRRGMTSDGCKKFNTFIHEDIGTINNICRTPNIRCKRGRMNCHAGVVRVTDCRNTGGYSPYNCRYGARASTRRVVIACEGNPLVPVHLDS
ncbi:Ribonuclease 4 [Myotis brandtii]|uniref:Ribonuclease 4 n=1 Tax=Myotis brandtii TaxID=109478 RepID=S7PBF6_MYOBR|nr:PREDICTED: ribonuclease 4 [Myotis brandtii]EPQ05092.1 Ribonuclease 4 [Myotis brandtii]